MFGCRKCKRMGYTLEKRSFFTQKTLEKRMIFGCFFLEKRRFNNNSPQNLVYLKISYFYRLNHIVMNKKIYTLLLNDRKLIDYE